MYKLNKSFPVIYSLKCVSHLMTKEINIDTQWFWIWSSIWPDHYNQQFLVILETLMRRTCVYRCKRNLFICVGGLPASTRPCSHKRCAQTIILEEMMTVVALRSCPDVPQSHHHHPSPKNAIFLLLHWLPPSHTHSNHHEVLWFMHYIKCTPRARCYPHCPRSPGDQRPTCQKTTGSSGQKQHLQHLDVKHRAPQGCLLSPLLFSLLTHDLFQPIY